MSAQPRWFQLVPAVLVGLVFADLPMAAQAPSGEGGVGATVGGQLRLRSETWSNFGFAEPNDDTFILARLLLTADVRAGTYLRGFVRVRSALSTDRSLPGGRRGLDADDLDLQDAFLDLIVPVSSNATLTARAGRQGLLFGKQRLISPLAWANTERTFDGASAILTTGDWVLHGFWAQPVPIRKTEFNKSDTGRDIFGLYVTDSLPDAPLGIDLYWLGVVRDGTQINGTAGREERHTVGARLGGAIAGSGFSYDVEAAYQFGDVGDESISAFMVATQLAYALDLAGAPRLRAGLDFASGDDADGGSVGTFNQLFPLGHAYLGFADVVGRQNIVAASGGLDLRPADRLDVKLTAHHFRRADAGDGLYNAGGGLSRAPSPGASIAVGNELDLTVGYRFDQHVSALLGWSRFFAGGFIEDTGPAEDANFLYTSVSLSP